MKSNSEINGVKIGDVFQYKRSIKCKVVDFHVIMSVKSGKLIGYRCIAKGIGTMATNEFEVPFATVVRNRV